MTRPTNYIILMLAIGLIVTELVLVAWALPRVMAWEYPVKHKTYQVYGANNDY